MTRLLCGLPKNTPTIHEKGIYCLIYSHVPKLQTTCSCLPCSSMSSPPLHSIVDVYTLVMFKGKCHCLIHLFFLVYYSNISIVNSTRMMSVLFPHPSTMYIFQSNMKQSLGGIHLVERTWFLKIYLYEKRTICPTWFL